MIARYIQALMLPKVQIWDAHLHFHTSLKIIAIEWNTNKQTYNVKLV